MLLVPIAGIGKAPDSMAKAAKRLGSATIGKPRSKVRDITAKKGP